MIKVTQQPTTIILDFPYRSGEHDEVSADVPSGLLVLTLAKTRYGSKYSVARTRWDNEKQEMIMDADGLRYIGARQDRGNFVHVIEVDGEPREFAPPVHAQRPPLPAVPHRSGYHARLSP